jgi:hypothetical protein
MCNLIEFIVCFIWFNSLCLLTNCQNSRCEHFEYKFLLINCPIVIENVRKIFFTFISLSPTKISLSFQFRWNFKFLFRFHFTFSKNWNFFHIHFISLSFHFHLGFIFIKHYKSYNFLIIFDSNFRNLSEKKEILNFRQYKKYENNLIDCQIF